MSVEVTFFRANMVMIPWGYLEENYPVKQLENPPLIDDFPGHPPFNSGVEEIFNEEMTPFSMEDEKLT